MTSPAFHRLFGGPPRTPEQPLTEREMDLAASIQVVLEEVLLKMARHAADLTGERNLLCLAGGVGRSTAWPTAACFARGRSPISGSSRPREMPEEPRERRSFAWHQLLGEPRTVNPARQPERVSAGPGVTQRRTPRRGLDRVQAVYRPVPDDDEVMPERCRIDRQGRGRRLGPGTDGVWSAGARQPEHSG